MVEQLEVNTFERIRIIKNNMLNKDAMLSYKNARMRYKLNCLLFDDPTSHAITHVGCREHDT